MSRGKRTDPTQAILVRVLSEMGFGLALISGITRLPRGTVKDIVQGNGAWATMPESELTEQIRLRVIETVQSVAYGLTIKAMCRLNEKINTASFADLLSIMNVWQR